eukprot:657039-Pyramimonas_sp.AAC.1
MSNQHPRYSNATDEPDCCVLTILNRSRTPFLGPQLRGSSELLRTQNRESFQNATSGTSIMGSRGTLAMFYKNVRGATARATF